VTNQVRGALSHPAPSTPRLRSGWPEHVEGRSWGRGRGPCRKRRRVDRGRTRRSETARSHRQASRTGESLETPAPRTPAVPRRREVGRSEIETSRNGRHERGYPQGRCQFAGIRNRPESSLVLKTLAESATRASGEIGISPMFVRTAAF
jgi:hypothetical protein